ncbi:MAG: hypothetical protein AAF710_06885 [Planctomycetota bacterium]
MDKLPGDADCPECGRPIAASRAERRVGLPWQHAATPRAWLSTAAAIAIAPKSSFGRLDLGGSNLRDRLFLLSVASLVGGGWGLATLALTDRGFLMAWLQGMAAAKVVLAMSYVEVLGVTLFSRRRGWRVPITRAERVVAYASVGWVAAAAVLTMLRAVDAAGWADRWITLAVGTTAVDTALLLAAVGFGLAVLGFETLVWVGVRAVRYGNAPAPAAPAAATLTVSPEHD